MQRIVHGGESEQTLQKSRFVARVEYCPDERAVYKLLQGLANQHNHAHHLAFAYRVKNPEGQGYQVRLHDAGEPSGTAGRPLMQLIEGHDLLNVCIAVIRYYGGINLGTGGLARAYGGTAKLALDAAGLAPYVEMQPLKIEVEYARLDAFVRDLEKLGGEVQDRQFGQLVSLQVMLPANEVAVLTKKYL